MNKITWLEAIVKEHAFQRIAARLTTVTIFLMLEEGKTQA